MTERWRKNLLRLIPVAALLVTGYYLYQEAVADDHTAFLTDEGPATLSGIRGYAQWLDSVLVKDRHELDMLHADLVARGALGMYGGEYDYLDKRFQYLHGRVLDIELRISATDRLHPYNMRNLSIDRETLRQLDLEIHELTERIAALRKIA